MTENFADGIVAGATGTILGVLKLFSDDEDILAAVSLSGLNRPKTQLILILSFSAIMSVGLCCIGWSYLRQRRLLLPTSRRRRSGFGRGNSQEAHREERACHGVGQSIDHLSIFKQ